MRGYADEPASAFLGVPARPDPPGNPPDPDPVRYGHAPSDSRPSPADLAVALAALDVAASAEKEAP
ncbi:MAG: hypothetical protein ACRDPD_30080 [Streptosporangiaceae bacterium]